MSVRFCPSTTAFRSLDPTQTDPSVNRIRIFHPYVESLTSLYQTYEAERSPSTALLLSTVIYLASMAAPQPVPEIFTPLRALRHKITPYLLFLRDNVLLTLPQSFHAVQALEMMATHGPLGVMPTQLVNPRLLAVARGQVAAAVHISGLLRYISLVRQSLRVARYNGWRLIDSVETSDLWLWLDVVVSQARLTLDDETVERPEHLPEARNVVNELFAGDYQEMWRSALQNVDPTELLGRLAVSERIIRLSEVIDCIIRIRGAFEAACADWSYDVVGVISEELRYISQRLDDLDVKHDSIMQILSPATQGVEAGWLAYRSLRRRFEANKAYVSGIRAFTAICYIPGHPLAFPGLPTHMQSIQKSTYAMSRIFHPPDMLPAYANSSNPAGHAVMTWTKHRGGMCESILASFMDSGPVISSNTSARALIPYHDAFSIVAESAKLLVELQAGRAMLRSYYPQEPSDLVPLPSWLPTMRQTAVILGEFARIGSQSGDSSYESVARGCANLVGSMVRLTEDWAREINKGGVEGLAHAQAQAQAQAHAHTHIPSQHQMPEQYAPMGEVALEISDRERKVSQDEMSSGTGPVGMSSAPTPVGSIGASGSEFEHHQMGHAHPQHAYMDTSDRWLAGTHGTQTPQEMAQTQPLPHLQPTPQSQTLPLPHPHQHPHAHPLPHPHALPEPHLTLPPLPPPPPNTQEPPHLMNQGPPPQGPLMLPYNPAPSPLDQLLSHMFNYPIAPMAHDQVNGQQPNHQGQHQQALPPHPQQYQQQQQQQQQSQQHQPQPQHQHRQQHQDLHQNNQQQQQQQQHHHQHVGPNGQPLPWPHNPPGVDIMRTPF